jgi:hypothetical protein
MTIPQESKRPVIYYDLNCLEFFKSYRLEGVDPQNPDENVIYFDMKGQDFITEISASKKSAYSVEINFVEVTNKVPCIIMPQLRWEC